MAHQVCVLTAFSEDRLRQSSTVVTSVNCLELSADGHFAWDVPWQGLKPVIFQSFMARLKSCPDTKQNFCATRKVVPRGNSSSHAGSKALICGELFGTGEPVPFQVERLSGGLRLRAREQFHCSGTVRAQ